MTQEALRPRRLVAASLVATAAMGLAMLLARLALAAPLPPEMLFNYTGQLLGVPWIFNLIHSIPWGLDAYAKYALFATTAVIYLAAWFGLGLLYPALRRAVGALAPLAYPVVSVLLVGLVLLPIQRLGAFGVSGSNFLYPPLPTHLWAAAFGLVFGLALAFGLRGATREDPSRRETLRSVGKVGMALGLATVLGRLAATATAWAQELVAFLGSIAGLSPEVTPTDEHYVVSKNVFNPSVPEEGWSLQITGMVNDEIRLSLDDLKALPSVERTSTLTCISNAVGGDLIGNSVWTGVRLADLLETAGVQDGATELVLRAADNYSDSFPLDAATREGTIVAYLQNGEPLTRDHGFPARVLVPGIYGMKNVKWVQTIELTTEDFQGYWQTRGWSDVAIVQTMSRIDTREATRLEDGTVAVGGVAFAGLRGVDKVEVSVDNGQSWEEATLDPPENELSWTLWGYRWEGESGAYDVVVRATDGTGTTQTPDTARPLPDGATGWHKVRVQVP